MSDLAYLNIPEVASLLRSGEVTSVSITEAALRRIADVDPHLNAFITVTSDLARQQAKLADDELAAGVDRGPLHGVPVAIKDLFATAGIRTTAGSKLFEHWVPDHDATAVAKLAAAGAVCLGKTGMHELARGTTSINPWFGAIHNPWALDHHPGGSSGGSAAAVAAGLAYAALGSDTGASVRQPAQCCGIVGFKPSFGLVSKHGAVPLGWSLDHVGPLTRSVDDAGLVLAAIAGFDPADPYSVATDGFQVSDAAAPVDGVRVGVPRWFFTGGDPEVVAVVETALEVFTGLGAAVADVDIPGIDEASAAVTTTFAEAGAVHRQNLAEHPELFSEEVRSRLLASLQASVADYAWAQHVRAGFRRTMAELMRDVDVLVAPTSTVAAGPIVDLPPEHEPLRTRNTRIFNFTGQPSISVPCGFTAAGLPVGLMISGRMFQDGRVLAVARAFEGATEWHRRYPPRPELD